MRARSTLVLLLGLSLTAGALYAKPDKKATQALLAAAGAAAPDFAKGTLTVNGKTVTLSHAYLLPDSGTPPAVLLFLTDVPVAQSVLSGGSFAIDDLTNAGSAHIVKIRVTLADKVATSSSVYHDALRGGETGVVGAGDFAPTAVTRSLVAGKVSMAKPREVPEGTYQYAATFRATFGQAAAPAAATTSSLAAGRASGTLTVNGKTAQLTHAWAWVDTKDERKPTVLLIGDRDVPEGARRGSFDLSHMAREGQFAGVLVYFDKDQEIFRAEVYHVGFDGQISATGMHVFDKVVFDRSQVEGRLYTRGEQSFFKNTWGYEASFKALIKR